MLISDPWLGLPKNIFFLLIIFLIIGILYLFKMLLFRRFQRILPTDIRNTEAMDGHECWASVEIEVDNFLSGLKIPHKKPTKAKFGQYFTESDGVPNFVIYKNWDLQEIHSMIEIRNFLRPKKKYAPIIHTPNVKPNYHLISFDMAELLQKEWKKVMYKEYKELREDVKKWAQEQQDKLKEKEDK